MPLKTICKAPGCCRLVDASLGTKYCVEHQHLEARDRERKAQWSRPNQGIWDELYHSPKWQELRRVQLEYQPLCEICGDKATEVHHKIPHCGNRELFFDADNLMSICHTCLRRFHRVVDTPVVRV